MLHLAALLAAVPASAPLAQDDAPLPDGNLLVHATLLADREAVKPGGSATLAVRLVIEPKWHVYWENPGNSGMPTRAQVTAPAGWDVGPLRFPWPRREEDEGDIVTFVHDRELVLLCDVKAPADAQPGVKAAFAVEASWLVCTDICVPGSGKAALDVPVAEAEKPANAALFAAARARLPRPWSELAKARATWLGDEGAPRLSLIVPGAKALELFPYSSETLQMESRTLDVGKSGATLKAGFEFRRKQPQDSPRVRGVLWVRTEQGEASYLLDTTWTPPAAGK